MKVLLTGASSFTGLWFAESLAAEGFRVVVPLRKAAAEYSGLRGARVRQLAAVSEVVENCWFGDNAFIDLAGAGRFDLLCHHAAQVENYKSPDFDALAAVADNTHNLTRVLDGMKDLRGVILTGSVFEADEGVGTEPREAFSPYGLSKTLTREMFRYRCGKRGVPLTRFVIANPFGPYEEPRFCDYLVKCWRDGRKAVVKTPDYVRDNIPVSLLGKIYADTAKRVAGGEAIAHCGPSFYAESQGAFAQRMTREMAGRLGLECGLELTAQTDFGEPLVRTNSDKVDGAHLGWDEKAAWDELAAYVNSGSL